MNALGAFIVGAVCASGWSGLRDRVASQPARTPAVGQPGIHAAFPGEPAIASVRLADTSAAKRDAMPVRSHAAGVEAAVTDLSAADVGARLDAVLALADEGGDSAAAALAAVAVGDVDVSVREAAVTALGEIDGAVSLHALTQALKDPEAEVRRVAVEAFAEIGDDQSARALTVALQDADVSIRAEAVDALADMGGATAVRLLRDAAQDENRTVREAAAEYLADLSL